MPGRLDARVRDPRLVCDGKTGLLVEQRDATALADAIQRLVEDPALARRLGMAGRRAVLREFTLERNGALLLERFAPFIGLAKADGPSGCPDGPSHFRELVDPTGIEPVTF